MAPPSLSSASHLRITASLPKPSSLKPPRLPPPKPLPALLLALAASPALAADAPPPRTAPELQAASPSPTANPFDNSLVTAPQPWRPQQVTMQAPKEIPPDCHCKDKFLVQSIVVQGGTTQNDIVPDMFSKAPGRVVEEFKLRVVYIPANPPSPVPKGAEEEIASLDSEVDYEVTRPSTLDAASEMDTFFSETCEAKSGSGTCPTIDEEMVG